METSAQKTLAMNELTVFTKDVGTLKQTAESFEVEDDQAVEMVGDFVVELKRSRKKLEDKRLSLVKPLKQVTSDIDAMFKAPRDTLDELIGECKSKISAYSKKKLAEERARKEREEQEAKEQADAALEAAATAEEYGDDKTASVLVEQADKAIKDAQKPAQLAPSRGEKSTVSTVKTWKAKVTDLRALCQAVVDGQIPEEAISFKQGVLDKMARDIETETTIGGVEFYLDVSTSVR